MGRYITGDFEWKFEFGKQASNFGELIDDITRSDLNIEEAGYSNRFIGDGGEYVDIYVEDTEEFIHLIQQYIDEDKTEFLSKYDRNMLDAFIVKLDTVEDDTGLKIYIEY